MRHFLPLLAALFAAAVQAATPHCSRRLEVPVAPIGLSVTANNEQVGGVFVDFIREVMLEAGCELHFRVVPKARLEFMFESGTADLMLAATHSAARDKSGIFIPLVQSRAVLVSLESARPPIHSLAELIHATALRVAVVRGYDYGPAFQDAILQLQKQNRLYFQKDPLEITRMLKAGMADATILPGSTIYGTAIADERLAELATRLRFEPLEELPWSPAGVYLSRSLGEADRKVLELALQAAARKQTLFLAYRRYLPAPIVAVGTRPYQAD